MADAAPARREHPVFAAYYAVQSALTERAMARMRRDVLAPAAGRTLILGAGQGHDVPHLPPAVTQVLAIEPDSAMRRRGGHRVSGATVPAWYVAGTAEALPVPDASIDTVVSTLVLCSVDDPEVAARELHRVLRPDGRLLLLEHVRAESPRLARLQDRCDRVWGRLSGGCHLTRDTREVLIRAGFDDTDVRERHLGKLMPLLDRAIAGVAVPR